MFDYIEIQEKLNTTSDLIIAQAARDGYARRYKGGKRLAHAEGVLITVRTEQLKGENNDKAAP